ncbi:MAG: GSCFA domain-containing protein, partial [Flavobacteriales bacterium]
MKFTTEIEITPSPHRIQPGDTLVLMGSCFAQEMGTWFKSHRFSMCLNPNGIIFHPAVLARIIRRALENRPYNASEWIEHSALFHSFDHHGSFSRLDSDELVKSANQSQTDLRSALSKASTLIVTWGSAWGYKWNESGQWVANCHKIPHARFSKELMEAHAIEAEWREVLELLSKFNPLLNVIFSVSPVRYWRDGAQGNQLSKAHLLIAASALANAFSNVHYFPAYEIILDELRDYRFYASDLLHPSPVAVEYVIEKFQAMFFAEETK